MTAHHPIAYETPSHLRTTRGSGYHRDAVTQWMGTAERGGELADVAHVSAHR